MMVTDNIERIRAFAAKRGWTRNRIATEAGVAESTIRGIFETGWNPRIDTLQKLEAIVPADFDPSSRDAAA